MRAERQPRLSLSGALGLAILARWIAMTVVIIVGASAGKQARILNHPYRVDIYSPAPRQSEPG